MNPRHHNDCLNWIRILGSDIFQLKSVKVVLKVMLCIYSILSVLQIYFFASSPSMAKVFSCGAAFFQICYIAFVTSILLLKDHMVDDVVAVIDWWPLDSVGHETKNKFTKLSKWINRFAVLNISILLVFATTIFFSSDEDNGLAFVRHILDQIFSHWSKFFFVFFKITVFLPSFMMSAHIYQLFYSAQHIIFQMKLLKMFIRRMASTSSSTEEDLMYDDSYQEEINAKLKIIIDRHCNFIRWQQMTLMTMSNLIIPYLTSAILVALSIAFRFLQDVLWWPNYVIAVTLLANIYSIIAAGQTLEDESEKIFVELTTLQWYNWNLKNKKIFLTILTATTRPINIKFSEKFVVNNRMLLFIYQTLYSVLSMFLSMK
ncbi:hypothetical protein MTP99_004136 [Tenebrio molitor]|nr:hypothetical protein MTP99_004136 [Tenebrio molitor]